MIQIDMNKKRSMNVINKSFHLENDVLVLAVEPLEYELEGKTITAVFEPSKIETGALEVIDGVIQIPIYSSMIQVGVNFIQLNFRWDTTKLEQSGKLMWVIDKSLITEGATQEEVDIISYLINEVKRVVDETGDIKEALDESITNANTINSTLSNEVTGTIRVATDIGIDLEDTIEDANFTKGLLETTIDNSEVAKINLEGTIVAAGNAQSNLNAKIGEATTSKQALDQAIIDNQIVKQAEFTAHKEDYAKHTVNTNSILKENFSETFESINGVIHLNKSIVQGECQFTIEGKTYKETGIIHSVKLDKFVSENKDGTINNESILTQPIELRGFIDTENASDVLVSTGKIIRKVKRIVIDGNSRINKSGTQYGGMTRLYADTLNIGFTRSKVGGQQMTPLNTVSEFGEHKPLVADVNVPNTYRVYDSANDSVVFALDNSITGLNSNSPINDFKIWLTNNPIILYIQVDEPYFIEEQINMGTLPSLYSYGKFKTNSIVEPKIILTTLTNKEVLQKDINSFILEGDIRLKKYETYFELNSILTAPTHPTYNTLYAEYDNLVANSNGYATKTVLGANAQNHELVSYKFSKPSAINVSNFRKLRIGIMSGLHGNEKLPAYSLLYFMSNLVYNPYLNEVVEKIKANFDFYIIPVGNPTGWNNNTRNNGQNVNLNRNFDYNWISCTDLDKGASPASEIETQLIQSWMDANLFDYYFDFHVSDMGVSDDASWYQMVGNDLEMPKAYFKTINLLSQLYALKYQHFPQNMVFGKINKDALFPQSQNYAGKIGIKASLIEISTYLRYDTGQIYRLGYNWSTEILGNFLFNLCKPYI